MDSLDLSDEVGAEADGAEAALHLPGAVLSRIEELMGGTEQFDSADFDAVSYINRVFPTEQSLSGVEAAASRAQYRLSAARRDVRRLLRAHAAQRAAGQQAMTRALDNIRDLALQVSAVSERASLSDCAVREITAEIKQLDCAKCHLTAAITALNHLHMMVGGVDRLQHMTQHRQYKELVLPLQAIMEVLDHFECYKDIGELSALRERVHAIRAQLAKQILADFKDAFTGGSKAMTVSHRTLSEACCVVDVLDPGVKQELLAWLTDVQLQEYQHLFAADQECSWVSHVERRYSWLKKHLLTFEECWGALFPPQWAVSERIAQGFCDNTREQLTGLLSSRRAELDVKLLLYAIQKTYNFELLLHKRFLGSEVGAEGAEGRPGDHQNPFDAKESAAAAEPAGAPGAGAGAGAGGDASGGAGVASPWVGSIGRCFEAHLSLYIASLDQALRALMDRTIQESRATAGAVGPASSAAPASAGPAAGQHGAAGAGAAAAPGGAVLASCADLFLFYKKCLVQCARLTTGEPMRELSVVFQKYLREYAGCVLRAGLPRGAGGGGAGAGGGGLQLAALGAVTNLHTLLRDDSNTNRYSRQEISSITSALTTAEYCLETTVHLEQKLKEKVSPTLAAQIDFSPEQDAFHRLITDCIQLLVQDLELACEPALHAMTKVPWQHLENVGDQSSYITQIIMHLKNFVPNLRDSLASSRKYFTQFCIRFANSFIPKFIQTLYKCKPLSPVGSEQLLLDTHMLKTALLELPALGSEVKRPAPATYTKVVLKLMVKAEMLLKVSMSPLSATQQAGLLVSQAVQLVPECALAELHRVLDMRGERLTRAQREHIDHLFREAVQRAQAEGNK